ncbi:hypothetical protein SXIM_28900 [Streptomyces xiamenensis]|uniref:Uncharacterized protein n=1 Tax=Streptomyces xiamenensis TaxID=408015 RepID=A0A0F7FV25_9ACTN|nr:hypothetical protein SXIM_28900 [Streptomyces xiamenensis]
MEGREGGVHAPFPQTPGRPFPRGAVGPFRRPSRCTRTPVRSNAAPAGTHSGCGSHDPLFA